MRSSLATFAALFALLACGAAIANASGSAVLNDCTDDERMSKTYSQKDYRDALDGLAADADQYGNCRDVIRRAMLAAAAAPRKTGKAPKDPGAGDSSAAGDGAVGSAPSEEQLRTATAEERRAVDRARNDGAAPFTVNNATVDPARVGRVPGMSQVSDLPTPIVVLLALLLAGLLALGAVRVRSLVHARRA
ncbi:MAG: hypothetical protein QOD83_2619 [Solirubrobacteraceae bacterium]|jgi:hypothetical protein|nr:hypothetical protein [Solirubrobacteraceae bacterium]